MFRLLRAKASALSYRSLRRASNGEKLVIYKVRFIDRIPIKRTALTFIAVFICVQIYNSVVIAPLIRELTIRVPAERKPRDDEDQSIFLPFPLTTKQLEQKPYKGTDPEWQAFVAMARDRELQRRVRAQLAGQVLWAVQGSDMLKKRFGKEAKLRRYWIDIDYPYKPAPEFLRSGILIQDEGIEWVQQPVEPDVVLRTQRIMWPDALGKASLAFASTLALQNASDIWKIVSSGEREARDMGGTVVPTTMLPSDAMDPNGSALHKALQNTSKVGTKRPEDVDPESRDSSKSESPNPRSLDSNASSPTSTSTQPSLPLARLNKSYGNGNGNGDPSEQAEEKKRYFYGQNKLREITNRPGGPMEAFRQTFRENWKGIRAPVPRGYVVVSGLVELELPQAYIVIDCYNFYDPQKMTWGDGPHMSLRRFQAKKQAPRG